MSVISCKPFGVTVEGTPVSCYTLQSPNGASAEILTYGGALRTLCVPSRTGFTDVVLGYDSLADYENSNATFGALVGRVANRISDAAFMLDEISYPLAQNNGTAHLHGGVRGFHRRVWTASIAGNALQLDYASPSGEEGYPSALHVQVRYLLDDEGLKISYCAHSDGATIVNLTNHSYFNLDGHDAGTVLDHELRIESSAITESGEGLIPTGRLLAVVGTPFDFRASARVGARLDEDDAQLLLGGGYDHNYVMKREKSDEMLLVATLTSRKTGIQMECLSDQVGVQLYTANKLSCPIAGKGGAHYGVHDGLCLEAQAWPNAINQPNFPSCVLRAGEEYRQETSYRFARI